MSVYMSFFINVNTGHIDIAKIDRTKGEGRGRYPPCKETQGGSGREYGVPAGIRGERSGRLA